MILSGKSSCKWRQYPVWKQETQIGTAANAKTCCHINKGHTTLYLYTFSIKTASCDYNVGVGSTETSCLQLATSCYLQQNIPTPTPNRKLQSALLACSHRLPQHSLLVCGGDFGQLSCNLVVEPPSSNQPTLKHQPIHHSSTWKKNTSISASAAGPSHSAFLQTGWRDHVQSWCITPEGSLLKGLPQKIAWYHTKWLKSVDPECRSELSSAFIS